MEPNAQLSPASFSPRSSRQHDGEASGRPSGVRPLSSHVPNIELAGPKGRLSVSTAAATATPIASPRGAPSSRTTTSRTSQRRSSTADAAAAAAAPPSPLPSPRVSSRPLHSGRTSLIITTTSSGRGSARRTADAAPASRTSSAARTPRAAATAEGPAQRLVHSGRRSAAAPGHGGREKENAPPPPPPPATAKNDRRRAVPVLTLPVPPTWRAPEGRRREAPPAPLERPPVSPRPSSSAASHSQRSATPRTATTTAASTPRTAASSRRAPEESDEAAADCAYRHDYYYYPDDGAQRGGEGKVKTVEEEEGGSSSGSSGAPPNAPGVVAALSDDDGDIVELDDAACLTPPAHPLQMAGSHREAPFTPRGVPPSPYMERLAVAAAASSARRGAGEQSSGLFSPRVRGSLSASHRRSNNNTGTNAELPLDASANSAMLQSSVLSLPLEEADGRDGAGATEAGATAAAAGASGDMEAEEERQALRQRIAAARSRLGSAEAAVAAYDRTVAARAAEREALAGDYADIRQQLEGLQERTALATRTARDLESKRHTADELAMLRDMQEERAQRLEALGAKRDALSALWSQLQYLHEEAQAQERLRQEARRQKRQRILDAQQQQQQQEEEGDVVAVEYDEEDEEGEERSTALSASERRIKKAMFAVSRAKSALDGDGEANRPSAEVDASRPRDDDDDDEEPEAAAPTSACARPRKSNRGASLSPSLAAARAASVLSSGTASTLQSFLADLHAEANALAMICIQKPSPPVNAQVSRCNRGGGAPGPSAWVRDINTGNNGFFSFFGGATESHLSAKPLSTFLSCASRLARSAWRMEAELQLRARELATDAEEEALRRRLARKPDSSPAEEAPANEGGDCVRTEGILPIGPPRNGGGGDRTPRRGTHAAGSTAASPELSLAAGKRRSSTSAAAPPSPSSAQASPGPPSCAAAPLLFLPSIDYASPRPAQVSERLDEEQAALQLAYTHDVEEQRRRRRNVVRAVKDAYRRHVEPQLRRRLAEQRERQEQLARGLAALGVTEVSLQWEEACAPQDDDGDDDEVAAVEGKKETCGSGGGARRRAKGGEERYLRQVVVRTLQAAAAAAAASPHSGASPSRRTSTSTDADRPSCALPPLLDSITEAGGDAPIVTTTRLKLQQQPSPSSSSLRQPLTPATTTPRRGAASRAATPTSCNSPLKSVLPISPSPLKARSPLSLQPQPSTPGRQSTGRATNHNHQQNALPQSSSARARHADPAFTEATRELVGASGRRQAPLAVSLTGFSQQQSREVLESGAVRVSILFHGAEARRRQRAAAAADQHLREFWLLREELARVDEDTFLLKSRLQQAEEADSARRGRQAASMQECMEKLNRARELNASLKEERREWEYVHKELQAVQASRQI